MLKIYLLVYLLFKTAIADPTYNNENDKIKTCDKDQCQIAAEIINKLINKNLDPCDNFYNYVCSNWAANYPIPDGKDVWSIDKLAEYNAVLEVKEILEEEESSDDIPPLKYEKLLYKSCMDLDKIEEVGIKPMEDLLNYFGGWPITMNSSDWKDDGHDWQGIHDYYSTFKDLSSIFYIQVAPDNRNLSKNAIHLDKPAETLFDELMKTGDENSASQKYAEFIKSVALIFINSENKTISDGDLTKDVDDILTFEKNLRQIKTAAKESDDMEPSRTYITIKDLQDFYNGQNQTNPSSNINWLRVFSTIFNDLDINITIDDSEDIGIEDTNYLRKLSHLLDETPNRIIVNYIHWNIIATTIKYTNKDLRAVYMQLTTKADARIPERWEICKSDIKVGVGYRYQYIQRHLSEETKKLITDITSETRSEMLDEVERSTWLDDNTKEETMIKLHALKWNIGVSNFYVSRDLVEHVYDGLTIGSNYFENIQSVRGFLMDRNLNRLRHHRHYQKYVRMDPLEAKSVYEPSRNMLVVSAAQLSVPLLHSSLPLSINYGYIAPTIGQLMSRAMEKEVNTNVYIPPWSSYFGDTYQSYNSKTECLSKQYYNYSVGPETTDQNMYDAIGLKVAYNAFQSSFYNENIEKLPNLEELSDDQLFFISFALKYCETTTDKYITEHSPTFYTPNEYRVIGTLSNLRDFTKAFNCSINSPMNPDNKCTL